MRRSPGRAASICTRCVQGVLLDCDGPGIMCAMYVSDPDSFPSARHIFPPDQVELDARGRLELGNTFGYIDVGEIKSTADYSTAVPQLGRNLKLLRWMAETLFTDADVRCVGRLFVPSGEPTDSQQQQIALDRWNYSLYVHHV